MNKYLVDSYVILERKSYPTAKYSNTNNILTSLQYLKQFIQKTFVKCCDFHKIDVELLVKFIWRCYLQYFNTRVYSEEQPGDAATALFIKKLSEEDAGEYRCTAVYASNQQLEARVVIDVYSKFSSNKRVMIKSCNKLQLMTIDNHWLIRVKNQFLSIVINCQDDFIKPW